MDSYECHHGIGYSRFLSSKNGLKADLLAFVPVNTSCEINKLTLTNTTDKPKTFSLFSYVEFCLWNAVDDSTNFQRNLSIGEVEIEGSTIYHKTEYRERRKHYSFFSVNCPVDGYDTSRDAFLGHNNGNAFPAAVKENKAEDVNYEMIAAPVDDDEAKMTEVPNNGHAMAPYMMSVGLWVGALAFCLMYPLTKYNGKLKSGFAWWGSKASVLYPLANLQGILVIFLLHVFDGFTPAQMGKAVAFACLTSVAFTSIMYFFNISLGKVGSFLMLVFMVIQLAGSAGTYPVQLSPAFVSKIHAWVPFTYSVDAFRSVICAGESIQTPVIVMCVITIVFTILTIIEFQFRTRRIKAGKPIFHDFLEEKGLA